MDLLNLYQKQNNKDGSRSLFLISKQMVLDLFIFLIATAVFYYVFIFPLNRKEETKIVMIKSRPERKSSKRKNTSTLNKNNCDPKKKDELRNQAEGFLKENSKSFKRIGSKPTVKAFCQQFSAENDLTEQKTQSLKIENEAGSNNSQVSKITEIQQEKSIFKRPLQENTNLHYKEKVENRKLKRIGRKVWVTAYKQQVNEELSRQNTKQMNLLQIPINEAAPLSYVSSSQTGCKSNSATSESKCKGVYSYESYSNDAFSEFHEESQMTEQKHPENLRDLNDQILSKSLGTEILSDDKIQEKIENFDQAKFGVTKKIHKQISIYENDACLINVSPDIQLSEIGEKVSVTIELKGQDLLSDRSQILKDEPQLFQKNPGIQQKKLSRNQDDILKQYEQKIDQYLEIKKREKTVEARKSVISQKRNSKSLQVFDMKVISDSLKIENKNKQTKTKKSSILRKPLPPAYPFNQQNPLINSMPLKKFNSIHKNSTENEASGLKQSIQLLGSQFTKKLVTASESTSPIYHRSPPRVLISKADSLKDSNKKKFPQLKNSNLEKSNSKSLHDSLHKTNKTKRLEVSKYIGDAKKEILRT